MKKFFLLIALAGLAFPCYSDMSINALNCNSIANGNLTGCFLNKTNSPLKDFEIVYTTLYENGSSTISAIDLNANQPNYYIASSESSAKLEQQKISSILVSIAIGDGFKYQVMPGCTIKFTPQNVSTAKLTMYKVNNNLYCK